MKQAITKQKPTMARKDSNHSFNVNVACVVGIEKAILLKEIYGWCEDNYINQRNTYLGIPFTFNSATAYQSKFPYLSDKSISRWLFELQEEGWILSSKKMNRKGYDRTKAYTLNFFRYDAIIDGVKYDAANQAEWNKKIGWLISQIEQSKSQNEEWISHFEEWISQNEQPIPSLTHLLPSHFNKSARQTAKTKKQIGSTLKRTDVQPKTEPRITEIEVDFEPLAPQSDSDVRTLIARANLNGDTPTSRLALWEIYEPYLDSKHFKTQWKFYCAGIENADAVNPADVMRDWVKAAAYYDVKEVKYNKISGWIRTAANTLKNGKKSSADNEPRFGASTVANLDRAYRELLAEGFK